MKTLSSPRQMQSIPRRRFILYKEVQGTLACRRWVGDEDQITTELVECGTIYRALLAFRTWLQEQQCPVVAMESTGVYTLPGILPIVRSTI